MVLHRDIAGNLYEHFPADQSRRQAQGVAAVLNG